MNDGDEPDPLMELFRTEVREQLATLRGDAEPPDKIRAAHTIRGAARIVGATALAEIAADLEARLGTHPGEDFTPLYESIEALADRGGEFPIRRPLPATRPFPTIGKRRPSPRRPSTSTPACSNSSARKSAIIARCCPKACSTSNAIRRTRSGSNR